MTVIKCHRRHCATILVAFTDTFGRVGFECPACERNKVGLCRDCPNPLAKQWAFRCPACVVRVRRAKDKKRQARYRRDPRLRARQLARKKRYDARPEVRARQHEANRAIARRRPARDALDRAYKRAYDSKRREDPAFCEQERARHARRRAAQRNAHAMVAQ